MRFLLAILFCVFISASCWAQTQENTLSQRLNLDPTKDAFPNALQKKKFQGGGGINLSSNAAQNSSFNTKQFESKEFATRSFLGIKNPWFGNKVFESKTASVAGKTLADEKKSFGVNKAQTQDFSQADNKLADADKKMPTKETEVKPAADGGVKMYNRDLTIDDVREILNKNH